MSDPIDHERGEDEPRPRRWPFRIPVSIGPLSASHLLAIAYVALLLCFAVVAVGMWNGG